MKKEIPVTFRIHYKDKWDEKPTFIEFVVNVNKTKYLKWKNTKKNQKP